MDASALLLLSSLLLPTLTSQEDGGSGLAWRRQNNHEKNKKYEEKETNSAAIADPCTSSREMFCNCSPQDDNPTTMDCFVLSELYPGHILWDGFRTKTGVEKLVLHSRIEGILTFMPVEALKYAPHLVQVQIRYGNIQTVPPYSFHNLADLMYIDLAGNGIQTLADHAFTNLRSVDEITLTNNHIGRINRMVFVSLPKLKKLYLDRNNISEIEDGAFTELGQLMELEMLNNHMTHLRAHMFEGLSKLRRIDFTNNRIRRLKKGTFWFLPELREINLRENHLEDIESGAFDGLQLSMLYLAKNRLRHLSDDTFRGLTELVLLDLRSNHLHNLHEASIKPLKLRDNPLAHVFLQDNEFVCDCHIRWMLDLQELRQADPMSEWKQVKCQLTEEQIADRMNRSQYLLAAAENDDSSMSSPKEFPIAADLSLEMPSADQGHSPSQEVLITSLNAEELQCLESRNGAQRTTVSSCFLAFLICLYAL